MISRRKSTRTSSSPGDLRRGGIALLHLPGAADNGRSRSHSPQQEPSTHGDISRADGRAATPPVAAAVAVAGPVRKSRWSGLVGREAITGLLFVSPFIIGFVIFSALPMVASFILSLTDFDPRRPEEIQFVGLDNYLRMLSDPILLESLWVTVRFALLVVPLTLGFALGIAMLVNNTLLSGRNVFRTLFYMPMHIPIVASTLVWMGMLHASNGWLNMGLAAVGIPGPNWLQNPVGSDRRSA